jgi:tRNA(Ile)-lysidine synthase
MTSAIINKFREHINTLKVFMGTAVGVSGGSDSLALMLLLHELNKESLSKPAKIVALTVNHNLRAGSEQEALYVSQLSLSLGIEHHTLTWNSIAAESNIHHRARLARLNLLTQWCKKHDIFNIMLGHTKDDLVETFFMNAFRGSGVYGLSSMPIDTIYNGVRIIRPLSNFTKSELQQFLLEKGIKWIEDPSNQNDQFLRSRVRKALAGSDFLALTQGSKSFLEGIITSVTNLNRTLKFIEESATSAMVRIVGIFPDGHASLNRLLFRELPEEIGLYMLSSVLITISGRHEYKPRLKSLLKLYEHVCQDISIASAKKTLWNCELTCTVDKIHIYKELGKGEPTLERLADGCILWNSRFVISVHDSVRIKDIKYAKDVKPDQRTLPLIRFAIAGSKRDNFYVPFIMPQHPLIHVHFHPTIPVSKR